MIARCAKACVVGCDVLSYCILYLGVVVYMFVEALLFDVVALAIF